MATEAITLDAYGTLIDLDSHVVEAVASSVREQNLDVKPEDISRAWTTDFFSLLHEYDSEPAPEFKTIYQLTYDSFVTAQARYGLKADVARVCEVWFDHVKRATLYPEAREAVKLLGSRYKLAVVSDADDEFLLSTLERENLGIEIIITSEAAKSYKIDPSGIIFERAREALGVEVGSLVHIGDSTTDVIGAMRAGEQAIWLARNEETWSEPSVQPKMQASDLLEAARCLAVGGA